eukprot:GDKI01032592.1.p1 GENE.GDKI01032592.1~~GDKI01032592.1.p1  ORF type:complete len:210 (-),score=33.58 GDKI01032592.1:24-653(-)
MRIIVLDCEDLPKWEGLDDWFWPRILKPILGEKTEFISYKLTKDAFPSIPEVAAADALVIGGSHYSAYENVHILPYGIADRDKRACFRVDGGASAQISDTHTVAGGEQIECVDLRATARVLEELGLTQSEFHVHMNCEGCEYDVLAHLIASGTIKQVETLQFGSHQLESTGVWGKVTERYCQIQMHLLHTHTKEFGIPWSWDRFVLKRV